MYSYDFIPKFRRLTERSGPHMATPSPSMWTICPQTCRQSFITRPLTRSLSSLDRVRQAAYRDMAEKAGISIVRKAERDPDVSIMQRHQYDIQQAMMWGRESFRKYVEGRSSDYL